VVCKYQEYLHEYQADNFFGMIFQPLIVEEKERITYLAIMPLCNLLV
jgi:hypothetical protein